MTATIASMPNPFNLNSAGEVAPKPAGSSDGGVESRHAAGVVPEQPVHSIGSEHCFRKEHNRPQVGVAPDPSEVLLPGLQIGAAGQQLDAVRFMHEIMPARRGVNLDDGLAAHVPLFLAMKAPD